MAKFKYWILPSFLGWIFDMRLEDCYRSLGLKSNASRADIKAAYHRFARQMHPDTQATPPLSAPQAAKLESQFLAITQAYKQLMAQHPPDAAPQSVTSSSTAPSFNESPVESPAETLKSQTYQRLRQLFTQQRLANAIALVEGLSARFPEDPEVRQWQAIAYQQQGLRLIQEKQYLQATRYLQKAIVTDPTNRTLKSTTHRALQKIQRLTRPR